MIYPKFEVLNEFATSDDLYICAMGFEDRSLFSNIALLNNNFKTKNSLIIEYDQYVEANNIHKNKLEKIWNKFSNHHEYVVYTVDKRFHGIENIKMKLELIKSDIKNITINITSLSTYLQTWIINYAFDNFEKIRIIYTQPQEYHDQSSLNNYAMGVDDIFTMSEFSGAILPGYSSLLIIFLGYDIIRAQSIYEHIQPHKKIGFIPPLLKSQKHLNIFEKHKEYFHIDDEISIESILDLENIINKLEHIRLKYIESSNISVAINGSKLHAVAATLFTKKHKDVQLILSKPLNYYPEKFSNGENQTYEILFDADWIKSYQNKL